MITVVITVGPNQSADVVCSRDVADGIGVGDTTAGMQPDQSTDVVNASNLAIGVRVGDGAGVVTDQSADVGRVTCPGYRTGGVGAGGDLAVVVPDQSADVTNTGYADIS